MNFRFERPEAFLILLLLPLMIWLVTRRKPASMQFSHLAFFEGLGQKALSEIVQKTLLRVLAVICIVIALARPQTVSRTEEVLTRGIDIMLVLDTSGSMLSMDFKPNNRLDASKKVVVDFVKGRQSDRIGAVIFAGEGYTQCPLTTDYDVLLELISQVQIGLIEDGTAIGMALATAVKRLKDSDGKSKVVILLTDGVNNAGKIEPITAANLAKSLGIKVYTIGVGKYGEAPFPIDDPIFGRQYKMLKTEIDEKTLKSIAQITGGNYYRADNERTLKRIYNDISRLEKNEVKVKEYFQYQEHFYGFVVAAALLLLLEILLFNVFWMRIP